MDHLHCWDCTSGKGTYYVQQAGYQGWLLANGCAGGRGMELHLHLAQSRSPGTNNAGNPIIITNGMDRQPAFLLWSIWNSRRYWQGFDKWTNWIIAGPCTGTFHVPIRNDGGTSSKPTGWHWFEHRTCGEVLLAPGNICGWLHKCGTDNWWNRAMASYGSSAWGNPLHIPTTIGNRPQQRWTHLYQETVGRRWCLVSTKRDIGLDLWWSQVMHPAAQKESQKSTVGTAPGITSKWCPTKDLQNTMGPATTCMHWYSSRQGPNGTNWQCPQWGTQLDPRQVKPAPTELATRLPHHHKDNWPMANVLLRTCARHTQLHGYCDAS